MIIYNIVYDISRVLNLYFNVTTGLLNETHNVLLVKIMVKMMYLLLSLSRDFILFLHKIANKNDIENL